MNIPAIRGKIGNTVYYSANFSFQQINELVDRKVSIDYSISLGKDGTITGLKEGTEKVRITCGDKQKIVTIEVEKESVIDKIIENIRVNYEIINGKLLMNISWDYIKDINNYLEDYENRYKIK